MRSFQKILLMIFGGIFLMIGIIGIFLPLLPTTPFIILTALCWAKSSNRFHTWLLENRYFGSMIQNWEQNRIIPLKIKWLAIGMMSSSALLSLYILRDYAWWLPAIIIVMVILASLWICSFPHNVKEQ
ncbi:YbaN family protein [Ignatzschineria sp. LJL83]